VFKLGELAASGAVVPAIASGDREGAVAELVRALVHAGSLPPTLEADVVKRVLQREGRDSTGFGCGVAVPHTKHPAVKRLLLAVGVSERGIDFSARDRQPVYSVFLLISPEESPEDHLQAMETIFRSISRVSFRRHLRAAQTKEDLLAVLSETDETRRAI